MKMLQKKVGPGERGLGHPRQPPLAKFLTARFQFPQSLRLLIIKGTSSRGGPSPTFFFLDRFSGPRSPHLVPQRRRMLMSRRRTLASLAALTAVLALLARLPARADDKPAAHHEMHEKCAKACFDCSRECASCFHHCAHLVADGKKEHTKTMHLCNDCGTICAAAGELSARVG